MKKSFIFSFAILGLLLAQSSSAATLFAGSATQVVYKGDTFVIDWYLDTERASLNTVDLTITYSRENLKVVDVSTGNSLLSLWIKTPTYDNESGTIHLIGGAPNGFNNSKFPLFRTTFRAENLGNAKISVDSKSQILKNDGQGSGETLKFKPLEFPIVESSLRPSSISSSTHPDQNQWYRVRDVAIQFEAKTGTDYSYVFTANSEVFPDDTPETKLNSVEYKNMPDGIYYFKLNSKVGPSPWQEAGVYRVQIDTIPPEEFMPQVGSDPNIFSGHEFLSFSTVDKTSGISHYKVKFGLFGGWKTAESPTKLQRPIYGDKVSVLAEDNAGNQRIETIKTKGLVRNWHLAVLIVIIAGLGAYLGIKKFKQSDQNPTI